MSIAPVSGFISAFSFSFTNTVLQNNRLNNSEPIRQQNNISFGYSSPLKTLWRKGKMPTVTKGFYGDVLTQKNISLEHLKPHSKGGKTCLSNLVLASREQNQARGNKDIRQHFNKEKALEYLSQFIDLKLKDFNGNLYIKGIVKTLRNLGIDI